VFIDSPICNSIKRKEAKVVKERIEGQAAKKNYAERK